MSTKISQSATHFLSIVFLCFTLLVNFAFVNFALAESPEAVVQKLVDKIQEKKNPSPIIEYVDWDEALKKLSAQEKQMMKITDAKSLREFFAKLMKDPVAVAMSRVEEQVQQMPEQNRAQFRQMMAGMEPMIRKQQKEMEDRIANSKYEVGKATVNGDQATVPVTETYQGKSEKRDVELVKKDRWLLKGFDGFTPRPQSAPPAAVPGAGAPGQQVPRGMPAAPPQ